MSKTMSIYLVVDGAIGGERIRVSKNTTRTVGDDAYIQTVTVPDDTGSKTLWAAASSALTAFSMCIIEVDPDGVYADDAAAAKLNVEFQGSGATAAAFTVRRECPLVLTTDDIGAAAATISETIDTIIATNTNAADIGDVSVRIILLS